MAKKRDPLSPEDLIEISKRGVKRFVRYDEGRQLYSMGRNRFIELAKKADSRYKVCGVVLCDTDKIYEYIKQEQESIDNILVDDIKQDCIS